ncbi:MAG: PD40 domain-containing protein [Ruminococcus sp.]|nr:PD40 domain-containing protein [Ruminococcus sp.]
MKNHIYKIFMSVFTVSAITAMSYVMPFTTVAAVSDSDDIFYDDFTGTRLDTDKWLIAEKNWGGTVTENGETVDYNGGVVSENVAVRDGNLVLTGLGDMYEGEQRGINRDGSQRSDGKRCGGAIATREYYASSSYEIRAKIAPELGCCSAMWTFEYEEEYLGDDVKITNHEIDIEFPGKDDNGDFSLSHALCTTWLTEEDYKTRSVNCGDQADGEFHTYRFDWHTGSDAETPRVEYYFDDVLTYTSYDFIPTNESRFWLGLWFPKYWAGTPDFDTTEFVIDYVKITPFHESGDTQQHESYPDMGWAEPDTEFPKGWLLWHSYSEYFALDSKMYLRTPDGVVKEISGDFIHAMNGSFGITPEQITFMAIDSSTDEWDVYLYDNGNITNLTKNSGFRNEDPKWSPDGKQIVFKRGYWDNSIGDFVYDLATLDINTHEVTMLTNDRAEDAMPFFSEDGKYIYYTRYTDGIGSIYRMNAETRETEDIYSETGVTAYYPIVKGEKVYFAKWYSAENHSDQLMCYDGSNIFALPYNSEQYDCSDPCPVKGNAMIYSGTENGEYDLYYYNGRESVRLTELCGGLNELGADYYSWDEYEEYLGNSKKMGDVNCDGEFTIADVVLLQKWLLAVPNIELKNWKAADFCNNDRLDAFDLCLMKKEILRLEH